MPTRVLARAIFTYRGCWGNGKKFPGVGHLSAAPATDPGSQPPPWRVRKRGLSVLPPVRLWIMMALLCLTAATSVTSVADNSGLRGRSVGWGADILGLTRATYNFSSV